jgi:hypothetical protein
MREPMSEETLRGRIIELTKVIKDLMEWGDAEEDSGWCCVLMAKTYKQRLSQLKNKLKKYL